ncbi:MAG: IS1096 element passenger TnpR family protein [Steroidobacteraceae bacterium]
MGATGEIGAVQLSVRLRGVSPPVTRRLRNCKQATLAQLHAALQVAFGWSDTHLYTFLIRGGQFGERARGMELAMAGGTDIPLAAFGFEIDEPFRYQYNLFVPWEVDCRVEERCLISRDQWVACVSAQGLHRFEQKPTERMARFLAEQGVDPTQPTTFLSDGGETVRIAQDNFRYFGEPILDWFHITMRMTVLTQTLTGVEFNDAEESNRKDKCLRELRRAKAFLWHGSVHTALQVLDDLTWDVDTESDTAKSFHKRLEEFMDYITANTAAIPDYADRRRHGEPIATGFTESAVNQVVSKRMVKTQQMRWTQRGAHTPLQVRARVLNRQLRQDFERWHPQLRQNELPERL